MFTIAKMKKKLKCPPTDEWVKKMWCVCVYIYTHTHIYIYTHTHTMVYYSATKKSEHFAICSSPQMVLEGIMLSEKS